MKVELNKFELIYLLKAVPKTRELINAVLGEYIYPRDYSLITSKLIKLTEQQLYNMYLQIKDNDYTKMENDMLKGFENDNR
jgi:hypothetical protein